MKVAIIGSRTFTDFKFLEENVHIIIYEENEGSFEGVEIISGGAKGADTLGIDYAKKHNLNWVIHEAMWKDLTHPDAVIKENQFGKYDSMAGKRRNTLIINDADIVIAFHYGSPGTADSLYKAKKSNKKIFNFDLEP